MSSDINYMEKPKLNNPIVVAGLPGIGLIGKLSVEYLIKELDAKKFAEITSDDFPGWVIRENGLVRDLKVNFYSASIEGSDRDLIIVTSDAQASSPKGQYQLSEAIVEILMQQGASTILTMAAFLDSEGKKSSVVGAATNKEMAEKIKEKDVGLLSSGRIVGMNGLIVSLGAEEGMEGFCLLGTTKSKNVNPDASKNVLSKFSEIFGLELDLSDFEDRLPDLPKFKPPKIKMPSVSGSKKSTSYIR